MGILIELINQPSTTEEPKVMVINASDWMSPIIEYLKSSSVDTNSQSTKLRIKTARYTQSMKSCTKSHSPCHISDVWGWMKLNTLREIHEGIYGQHMGSRCLAHKALRQGYYWSTLKKDEADFIERCDKCQKFAKTAHQPLEQLSNIVAPWSFA